MSAETDEISPSPVVNHHPDKETEEKSVVLPVVLLFALLLISLAYVIVNSGAEDAQPPTDASTEMSLAETESQLRQGQERQQQEHDEVLDTSTEVSTEGVIDGKKTSQPSTGASTGTSAIGVGVEVIRPETISSGTKHSCGL
ncbi:MAG: hypothetical protein OXI96_01025, partial [Acidimicrobiaceae bacterium]|nr:hypothetical protein [Acidimicrobiaceae bacterium]